MSSTKVREKQKQQIKENEGIKNEIKIDEKETDRWKWRCEKMEENRTKFVFIKWEDICKR